jgi:type III secretory pathway component EscV
VNKAEAQLVVTLVLALLNCKVQRQQRVRSEHGGAAAAAARGNDDEEEHEEEEEEEDGVPAVPALQLGVICFFRVQANLIKQMLAAGAMRGLAVVVFNDEGTMFPDTRLEVAGVM